MPPFITYNGQTGYFQNGQFIPATREQYDGLFNGNPFMNNPMFSNLAGRQQPLQQGQIVEPAMSNEQKIAQQSSNVPLEGTSSIQYGMTDQGLGFNQGKTFYPSTAMTKTGMALIGNPALGITANPYELQGAHNPYAPQAALVQQQALQQAIDNNQQQTVQGPQVQQTGVPLNLSKDGIFGAIQNPFVSQTETPEAIVTESKADGMIGPMSGGKAPVISNVKETATPVKSKMTNAQSQGLGMLIGAGAKLVKSVAPDNYDERVGMTKPNMIGTLAGDATFTQLGSVFGPVGLAVGGGIDIVKNILAYAKQKDKYDNKKIGVNTMQSMDDARDSMKPDYTGYARYGAEVKNPYLKQYAFGGGGPVDPKKKDNTVVDKASVMTGIGDEGVDFSSYVKGSNNSVLDIFKSEGYKEKLKNELEMSKGLMRTVDENTGFPVDSKFAHSYGGDKKYSYPSRYYSGGNFNFDEIYGDRLKSQENIDITINDEKGSGNTLYGKALAEMKTNQDSVYDEVNDVWDINQKGSIVIYKDNWNPYNEEYKRYQIPKAIDEEESHIGDINPSRKIIGTGNYIEMNADVFDKMNNTIIKSEPVKIKEYIHEDPQNITPYARKIIDENINPETSDYLKNHTEAIAKKRVSEIYLIEQGLLKPGGTVDDSHYNYIIENRNKLPISTKHMLEMIQDKDPEVMKTRFKNIMNKIAMQDHGNNPYLV